MVMKTPEKTHKDDEPRNFWTSPDQRMKSWWKVHEYAHPLTGLGSGLSRRSPGKRWWTRSEGRGVERRSPEGPVAVAVVLVLFLLF